MGFFKDDISMVDGNLQVRATTTAQPGPTLEESKGPRREAGAEDNDEN